MKESTLSQTDWAILRTLWGYGDMSSKQIYLHLLPEKNWSISTVKTLVSRLVKKGYLSANGDNSLPIYSSVYTEEECIRSEMHHTILRIYGDTLIHSDELCEVYGYADESFMNESIRCVNKYYRNTCDYLNYEISKHLYLMLHRSLRNMHSAMGAKDAPDWLRVGENYGFIHIAPQSAFDNLSLEQGLSFILANITIDKINHGLPFYFKQGLATILSSINFDWFIRDNLINIQETITTELVMDLIVEEDKIGEMRQHEIAYLFVKFIKDEYGDNTILDIVYNRLRISKFLNQQTDFLMKWKNYIDKHYLQ